MDRRVSLSDNSNGYINHKNQHSFKLNCLMIRFLASGTDYDLICPSFQNSIANKKIQEKTEIN